MSRKMLVLCVITSMAAAEGAPSIQKSTRIEASLDALRARFPNQLVIGFEEMWDPRPSSEPTVNLGPPSSSLEDVIETIRAKNPNYRLDLLAAGLVHVYPAHGTADPEHLLNLKLRAFAIPPDDCLEHQIQYQMDYSPSFSYTRDLSLYLARKKLWWSQTHRTELPGFVGDFLGDCYPAIRPGGPTYHDITVRTALNLMARRSLEVARGGAGSNGRPGIEVKPVSWKFRFRRQTDADSGLGGIPVFQSF